MCDDGEAPATDVAGADTVPGAVAEAVLAVASYSRIPAGPMSSLTAWADINTNLNKY